jgi:hypothetical protein
MVFSRFHIPNMIGEQKRLTRGRLEVRRIMGRGFAFVGAGDGP